MGKPYRDEILKLPDTYRWALDVDLTALRRAVDYCSSYPLLAIGSGGSFTAAALAARLHYYRFGTISRAMTPLETKQLQLGGQDVAAWLFSARGRNPDILSAHSNVQAIEPRELIALCMTLDSPLREHMERSAGIYLGFGIPSGKDGFLATNSLLATTVLLLRAYGIALEPSLGGYIGVNSLDGFIDKHATLLAPIWQSNYILLLHGDDTAVGAVDLESRFSEAALGAINVSNFRDFAHGRHHWLTRFATRTAVLCYTSTSDERLANATLRHIPTSVPKYSVHVPYSGAEAQFASLLQSFLMAASAGIAQGIDPGRPGVAQFGSSIYNLRSRQTAGLTAPAPLAATAIRRKTGLLDGGRAEELLAEWRPHFDQFTSRLREAHFKAIVFDLDGTLIARDSRFGALDRAVATALTEILQTGLLIGIATGRGGGAFDLFWDTVAEGHRAQVLIGSYNGAVLRWLDEPERKSGPRQSEALLKVEDTLRRLGLSESLELRARPTQLTIKPANENTSACVDMMWTLAEEALATAGISSLRVVRSTHSVDILPGHVSKASVTAGITERAHGTVLTIGDMGAWPGNDFELLADSYGLSVDAVSRHPNTCWNLLPAGIRGVPGTLHYLSLLQFARGQAAFQDNAFR